MIAIGADHGGYKIKEAIKSHLIRQGFEVKDFGTDSEESVDYPTFAYKVSESVASKECSTGIICCGTGIGVSMVANKVNGIRAAVISSDFCAEMARRHNDANVLCLGGRIVDEETAVHLTDIFLNTTFEGGRHLNRVYMMAEVEEKQKSK